jgi:hypothetical protein
MIRQALILCVLCAALMGCSAQTPAGKGCEGASWLLSGPIFDIEELDMCKERVSSSDATENRRPTEVACPGCPPEYLTRHNSTNPTTD